MVIDDQVGMAVAVQIDPLDARVGEVDARQVSEGAKALPAAVVAVALVVAGLASLEADEVQVAVAVEILS